MTASRAKQNFGALLEAVSKGPVAIERHKSIKAIVCSPETFHGTMEGYSSPGRALEDRRAARAAQQLVEKNRLIKHQKLAIDLLLMPEAQREELIARARAEVLRCPSIWPMPWGRCCEAGEQMDRVADGAPGCAGVRLQIPPLFKRRCRRTFMASPRLYSHAAGAGAAAAANVVHSLARKVSGQGLRAAQRFTGNEQRMQAHPSPMALVQVSIGPARAGQGLISTRRYGAQWRQQAGRHRPVDPAP